MRVHRHVHDLGLVGGEAAERADVGRALGQHHVARIAEDAGDQVQRHLRADGDHHVVGSARIPSSAITSQICSRSTGTPCAEPYCSATCPSRATRSATSAASASQRQRGQVRHATGEGHHLGAAGHREQCADLGGRHARRCARRTARSAAARSVRRASSVGRTGSDTAHPPDVGADGTARTRLDRPAECNRIGRICAPFVVTETPVAADGVSCRAGSIYRRGSTRHDRRRLASGLGRRRFLLSWHVAALNLDNLDDLPKRCRRCVFWELPSSLGKQAADFGSHRAGEGSLGLRGAAGVGLLRPDRATWAGCRPATSSTRRRPPCRAPPRCPPARSAPTRCC